MENAIVQAAPTAPHAGKSPTDLIADYPQATLAIIVVCVLAVLYMIYNTYFAKPGKPKSKEPAADTANVSEEKIDDLIKQIESAQE